MAIIKDGRILEHLKWKKRIRNSSCGGTLFPFPGSYGYRCIGEKNAWKEYFRNVLFFFFVSFEISYMSSYYILLAENKIYNHPSSLPRNLLPSHSTFFPPTWPQALTFGFVRSGLLGGPLGPSVSWPCHGEGSAVLSPSPCSPSSLASVSASFLFPPFVFP